MNMLRKLFRKIPILFRYELRYHITKQDKTLKECIKSKNTFLFLAADYGNLGDIAITNAQSLLLTKHFPNHTLIKIPYNKTLPGLKTVKRYIKEDDIITIIGGGNMGDKYSSFELLREFIIKKFKNNKIYSFPQTIDFSDSPNGQKALKLAKKIYASHSDLTLMAREETSYEFMRKVFPNNKIVLTPDVVMTLDYSNFAGNRNGVTICMRDDTEKFVTDEQNNTINKFADTFFKKIIKVDTHIGRNIESKEEQTYELEKVLKQFGASELVITDRLHGMIFSYITGTPAIVFPNGNFKVEKCYSWISECDYIKFTKNCEIEYLHELHNKVRNAKMDKDMFYSKKQFFEKIIADTLS
jgi:pyruvyl transferase EpsI